ncbi:hypothetical protein [Corallococcus caeni]|uniref:Carboxypeptidase regulatory-like domain-containing protein n=1 Tax=Corallococcus caeni TaxID=3082388 RepID=A0ABQ6QR85_9BACT|nr:hypothetical protein ASNO1_27680 [Corallococcus sp. NO1]
MNRLFVLAVLLCVACRDENDLTPVGPDRGGPAALVVHSDWWNFVNASDDVKDITVLLGDGSRFRQPLGRDGIARFDDPAITGPQDITVVIAGKNQVVASTTLAVEGTEVWVPSSIGLVGAIPSSRQATLTGRVTNLRGSPVRLRVVGPGFHGTALTLVDGTFSIDVNGNAPGKVALVVNGRADGVETFGLLSDIAVGAGRTVRNLVIPMDHPLDQRLPVEVTHLQPYDAVTEVHVNHLLGSELFFSSVGAGTLPMDVKTVARTPPFDTVDVRLSVAAGTRERIASGRVTASTRMLKEGLTTLALPTPMALTSPTPGTETAPGAGPRAGLTLRWSTDPAAHAVTVRLMSQQGEPGLSWYVTAPASVSGFTPFTLPAEVSAVRELGAGRYSVQWSSRFLGAGHGYQELFTQVPEPDAPDAWNTDTSGNVILQD